MPNSKYSKLKTPEDYNETGRVLNRLSVIFFIIYYLCGFTLLILEIFTTTQDADRKTKELLRK